MDKKTREAMLKRASEAREPARKPDDGGGILPGIGNPAHSGAGVIDIDEEDWLHDQRPGRKSNTEQK